MIENLAYIQNHGLEDFLKNEEIRWTCTACGSGLCVHRDICLNCKKEFLPRAIAPTSGDIPA
jgi:uncharacterized OB-fold protein